MRMCQRRIRRLSDTFNLESPFKCIDKDILGENVSENKDIRGENVSEKNKAVIGYF